MSIDTHRTVAEIAPEKSQAVALFEELGTDYCCGVRKPLATACEVAGIDVNHVEGLLDGVGKDQPDAEDWGERSLAGLNSLIVEKHHAYCREEGLRVQPLLEKFVSKHGEHHPELSQVQELFIALRSELCMHMIKDEQMLFPYIIALENSAARQSVPPRAPSGTVQNPVRMMVQEHDDAGELTKEICSLTANFTTPRDACPRFKALYQCLEAFEADLYQHIHLGNNILFPHAIALEDVPRAI